MAPLSLTGRLIQTVVRFSCARPALTVLTAVVLAALGVGYAAHALKLETAAAVLKWLAGAWVIVVIPVLAFFILKDAEQFTATALSSVLRRSRGEPSRG